MTVFLRVDVVGRDGAGKTSLTKSLTLQEFDPDELSTRGVVLDPKCQIIVKEACDIDWTTPLTIEQYQDLYEKNVTAIVADKLGTPEVKDRYLRKKQEQGHKYSHMAERYTIASTRRGAIKTSSSLVDQTVISSVGVRNGTEQNCTLFLKDAKDGQQHHDESDLSAKACTTEFQETKPDFQSDSSSLVATPVSLEVPFSSCTMSPASAPSNTAAPKPQSSMEAHQLALSKLITSNDEEEETAGTDSVFNCDAKETGEESIVTMSKGSKLPKKTAAVQCDQQPSQSTRVKRKKVAKTKTKKHRKRKTQATAPMQWKKRVSKFLRDEESLKEAQNEMMVTVLDYAGQHVFYATHHLCLSKAGFYYVVFDASQPLDGKSPTVFRVRKGEIVQIRLLDDETNFDRLLEWMSAIHIMEPDHSLQIMLVDEVGIASPAMFLVGTHADKLREQPGLLERQEELLKTKLGSTVLAKHIIWASKDRMCFYVDNTLTDPRRGRVDPQVRLLRQMTEEVARKVAQHHKLPVTWLRFEQEVRDVKVSDETKKTASVEELLHIAKKAAGIKTREELEVLLHYLSNRAVLLYHPKALRSGEEEVILDVEWLISQLEKVITIHTDVLPMFENDVRRSREKGIMTASPINHLLSDSGSRRHLMSLMKHFDLLCPYGGIDDNCLGKADDRLDYVSLKRTPTVTPERKEDVECKAYFVPCLLQKRSALQSSAIEEDCRTVPLILRSGDVRVPKPLFYRLLTHFATRFPRLPQLFANVGYFHVYPNHKMEISLERYHLQAIVFTSNKERLLPAVCFLVREYVMDEVDKAKHPGMSGLELKLGFFYSLTSDGVVALDYQHDFVSLEGYPELRKRLYVASIDREIDPPSQLKVWYPKVDEVSHEVICHSAIHDTVIFLFF